MISESNIARDLANLVRGFQGDGETDYATISRAKSVLDTVDTAELDWAHFCLNPSQVPPARMPSMFPIESHVIRKRSTGNLLVGSDTKNYIKWAPELYIGSSGLFADASGFTQGDNELGSSAADFAVIHSAITPQVGHGGCRLIGAYLTLRYTGKFDNASGVIDVGAHMHGSKNLTISVKNESFATPGYFTGFYTDNLHFSTIDEVQSSTYHQTFTPQEGVHLVWFPIDQSRFEFRQPGTNVVMNMQKPADTAFDLPVASISHPVTLEWDITVMGIEASQNYRYEMVSFYEVIPDTAFNDDYMPQRGPIGDSDVSHKVVSRAIRESGGAVAVNDVAEGWGSKVMNAISGFGQNVFNSDLGKKGLSAGIGWGVTAATGNPALGYGAASLSYSGMGGSQALTPYSSSGKQTYKMVTR